MLTLTVISVERFVAIVFPLRPGFTLRSTGAAIVAVWIVACAIAAPQLHVRYVQEVKWRNRHVIQCLERWPQYYDAACQQRTPTAVSWWPYFSDRVSVGLLLMAKATLWVLSLNKVVMS